MQRAFWSKLFFFSTFQVLSLKIILAFFDVQVKADTLPRKGCYFNSPSQFRKTLKIKALRKDPKALAKKGKCSPAWLDERSFQPG